MMSLRRGQSLTELMVAMSVIIVGLAAAGTVILSNVRLQERSADQVAAANLAREGVELAKAIRDSNWIAGGSTLFNEGLSDGNDYTGVPLWSGGSLLSFDFAPADMNDTETVIKRSTDAATPNVFVQGTGAVGTDTVFRRLVTLLPICSDESIATEGTDCGSLDTVGVQVQSTVTWTKREGTKSTTVEDNLYDWR